MMSPNATATAIRATAVRTMFDRVAPFYDVLNGVMSAGLHHRWRRRAADLAGLVPGDRVLDVACGTGDLTLELAARVGPSGEAVGCDFSEAMLQRARAKAPHLRFEAGDALRLAYGDDAFDAATVGFGARNFADLGRGLQEMARVVRPGGRVVVLDFTVPRREPFATFFGVWFDRVAPLLGRIAGRADAYDYLVRSVRAYPAPHGIAAVMTDAGLHDVRGLVTGGGIVTIHTGTVPGRPTTMTTV